MSKPVKFSDSDKPWNRKKCTRRVVNQRTVYKRFLIISEGTKTEPNYFRSMKDKLHKGLLELEILGLGTNTLDLVERAEEVRLRHLEKGSRFDQIWVLFDKDSFPPDDFDNAIHSLESARKRDAGYHGAWSNEAFELWFLLHFEESKIPECRSGYGAELSRLLGQNYQKNQKGLYEILEQIGDMNLALRRAKQLDDNRKFHENAPSKANPCTTVYLLMQELGKYLP